MAAYEVARFYPDGSGDAGVLEVEDSSEGVSLAEVVSTVCGMIGAQELVRVDFPNPGSPLHWHSLFWDAFGKTSGGALNLAVVTRMREVDPGFPDVYGTAVLFRDQFWTE